MGKLVQVKAGYTAVLLPNKSGDGSQRNYTPGDQVQVTDAEYFSFNAATLAAITVVTQSIADPFRKATASNAGQYSAATFAAAAGGAVNLGTDFVQAPASAVTYTPGFLSVPANNPGTGVLGPTPGSSFIIRVFHKQGATSASTAPTSKLWFGGTVRSDTVGTTNTSTTVTDTNIQATDVGRAVSGTGIPAAATIASVTPGVSFVLSAAATATGTVSAALGPLTLWPGGTVPTFTASTNAVDVFEFITLDGGASFYSLVTTKGYA